MVGKLCVPLDPRPLAYTLPDAAVYASLYGTQKRDPGYQELVRAVGHANVLGTWDDHDYGYDNSDGTYAGKDVAQSAFLDFFDALDDPRRERRGV